MNPFNYQNGELYAEAVPLSTIAQHYGSPCYVYSRQYFEQRYLEYAEALKGQDSLVCYAVKANSNIAVLNVLARLGAGFDLVSVGELERVLAAGGSADKIVFSGVGKTADEMRRALDVGIYCFNVESEAELERLNTVAAEMGKQAPVSIRVNPDVDAKTHPYISTGLKDNKFGIDFELAPAVYQRAAALPNIALKGVDCHIGSQLTETKPFLDAMERVLVLIDQLAEQGIILEHLDLGGGLGVCYRDEVPPSTADYIAQVRQQLGDRKLKLMFEPGRSIAANAGVLLTKVEYLKLNEHKNFAVIDAAMNDMLRPALYSAWMNLQPVQQRSTAEPRHYDVVGPVCETGDFLAKDRELSIEAGDLLALGSSGAYGFTMSSNYNSRGRVAEVMVDGDQHYLIRERETVADLMRGETLLP
ncbi:diaminopimelate decarboxylase [Spongiibacter sp. IMCC21906]|uniref:diaminopimelate decarboxylase n=1 Tax=Spongiibacter sp. IMCC21906 TaxID=1620392 RepID=UPI00062E00C1|nr:diaminopimelate decarboxylase [Spongiibacter sp. IMCC21906]AKH67871.1 diaminopimelate decarboxylase [Spongiibacter sp. IMCC21906]